MMQYLNRKNLEKKIGISHWNFSLTFRLCESQSIVYFPMPLNVEDDRYRIIIYKVYFEYKIFFN